MQYVFNALVPALLGWLNPTYQNRLQSASGKLRFTKSDSLCADKDVLISTTGWYSTATRGNNNPRTAPCASNGVTIVVCYLLGSSSRICPGSTSLSTLPGMRSARLQTTDKSPKQRVLCSDNAFSSYSYLLLSGPIT